MKTHAPDERTALRLLRTNMGLSQHQARCLVDCLRMAGARIDEVGQRVIGVSTAQGERLYLELSSLLEVIDSRRTATDVLDQRRAETRKLE